MLAQGQQSTSNGQVKQRGLPPHIVWPMVIVTLLLMSIGWSMWIVFAARSDGGAQVVENYYQKALDWDQRKNVILASEKLGWDVTLNFEAAGENSQLIMSFVDADGQPISNLTGVIKAYRPQTTAVITEMALAEAQDAPGVYRLPFDNAARGLWDFEVDVSLDSIRYLKVFRKELSF